MEIVSRFFVDENVLDSRKDETGPEGLNLLGSPQMPYCLFGSSHYSIDFFISKKTGKRKRDHIVEEFIGIRHMCITETQVTIERIAIKRIILHNTLNSMMPCHSSDKSVSEPWLHFRCK